MSCVDGAVGGILEAPERLPRHTDVGGAAEIPRPLPLTSDLTSDVDFRRQSVPSSVDGAVGVILAAPQKDAGGAAKIPRGPPNTAVSTSDRRLRLHTVPPGVYGVVGDVLEPPVCLPLQMDAEGAAKIPRPSPMASDSTPAVDPHQQHVPSGVDGTVGDPFVAPQRLLLQL